MKLEGWGKESFDLPMTSEVSERIHMVSMRVEGHWRIDGQDDRVIGRTLSPDGMGCTQTLSRWYSQTAWLIISGRTRDVGNDVPRVSSHPSVKHRLI